METETVQTWQYLWFSKCGHTHRTGYFFMKIVKQGFYIHDWVQQTMVEISTSSHLKQNFLISVIIFLALVRYRPIKADPVDVWLLRIVYRRVISEKRLTCNNPKLKDCETQTRNILQWKKPFFNVNFHRTLASHATVSFCFKKRNWLIWAHTHDLTVVNPWGVCLGGKTLDCERGKKLRVTSPVKRRWIKMGTCV